MTTRPAFLCLFEMNLGFTSKAIYKKHEERGVRKTVHFELCAGGENNDSNTRAAVWQHRCEWAH